MVKDVNGKLCQRVPDAQAAAELGVCVAYMHQQMRRGLWDLGEVIPPSKKNGKTNYAYHIYREKLDKHMYGNGKTAKQLEEFQKQNLKMIKLEALDAGHAIEQISKELEKTSTDADTVRDYIKELALAVKKIEVLAG